MRDARKFWIVYLSMVAMFCVVAGVLTAAADGNPYIASLLAGGAFVIGTTFGWVSAGGSDA